MSDTKACPWCGETILAVARKCKHCGEFMDDPKGPETDVAASGGWEHLGGGYWQCRAHRNLVCEICHEKPVGLGGPPSEELRRSIMVLPSIMAPLHAAHEAKVHAAHEAAKAAAVRAGEERRRAPTTGTVPNSRWDKWPISAAADRSSGVLACPNCRGSSFKAKRSFRAKALLIPTVGIGVLAAPKTRVKCITCGTEYLRR